MSMFITIDGIDGVGKSTQIEQLVKHLVDRGHDVLTVRDPGSTEIGTRLREILLESDLEIHRRTEAMLFMASRCEMIETTIRPALAAGKVVISDRFLLATVVYQSTPGGENQGAQRVAPDVLWRMGELANDGLRPDLTILLDMPAEKAIERRKGPDDRMEARGVGYMSSVRDAFLQQIEFSSDKTAVINADQTPDSVTSDLIAVVDKVL